MFQCRQHLQCRSSGVRPKPLQPDMLQTCRQVASVVAWSLAGRACSHSVQNTCACIHSVQPQRHIARLQLQLVISSITRTASCDTAQLLDVHMTVELGMCHNEVQSMAQSAARAAQSCNVILALVPLPDVLLQVFCNAAEHICWQVGDHYVRLAPHCVTYCQWCCCVPASVLCCWSYDDSLLCICTCSLGI